MRSVNRWRDDARRARMSLASFRGRSALTLGCGFLVAAGLVQPAFGGKVFFERSKPHAVVCAIGHRDADRDVLVTSLAMTFGRPLHSSEVRWEDPGGTGRLRLEVLHSKIRTYHPQWHVFNIHDPGITHATITGALECDGAILVVSATEGIVPRIREHVLLARQAGIPALVGFIDDADKIIDPAILDLIESEIRHLLARNGYDGENAPIVRGSAAGALAGDPSAQAALARLLDAMDVSIPHPVGKADKPFMMSVDDVIELSGGEVMAVGCIEAGRIEVGDEVEIVGGSPNTTHAIVGSPLIIIAEDVEGEHLATGDECVGMILEGIDAGDLQLGQVIAQPGVVQPAVNFKALVYVLNPEEGGAGTPFFANYRPQFYYRTEIPVIGTVKGLAADIFPGQAGLLEVELDAFTALSAGRRFVVRDGGLTVGAGIVVEVSDLETP